MSAAITQAAGDLKRVLARTKPEFKKRLRKGTIDGIIQKAKEKHQVPEDVDISERTI